MAASSSTVLREADSSAELSRLSVLEQQRKLFIQPDIPLWRSENRHIQLKRARVLHEGNAVLKRLPHVPPEVLEECFSRSNPSYFDDHYIKCITSVSLSSNASYSFDTLLAAAGGPLQRDLHLYTHHDPYGPMSTDAPAAVYSMPLHVAGRLQQIEATQEDNEHSSMDDHHSITLALRTPYHCTLVRCTAQEREVDEGATLSTPLLPVVRDTRSMEWNVAPLIAVQLARATSDVALSPHSRGNSSLVAGVVSEYGDLYGIALREECTELRLLCRPLTGISERIDQQHPFSPPPFRRTRFSAHPNHLFLAEDKGVFLIDFAERQSYRKPIMKLKATMSAFDVFKPSGSRNSHPFACVIADDISCQLWDIRYASNGPVSAWNHLNGRGGPVGLSPVRFGETSCVLSWNRCGADFRLTVVDAKFDLNDCAPFANSESPIPIGLNALPRLRGDIIAGATATAHTVLDVFGESNRLILYGVSLGGTIECSVLTDATAENNVRADSDDVEEQVDAMMPVKPFFARDDATAMDVSLIVPFIGGILDMLQQVTQQARSLAEIQDIVSSHVPHIPKALVSSVLFAAFVRSSERASSSIVDCSRCCDLFHEWEGHWTERWKPSAGSERLQLVYYFTRPCPCLRLGKAASALADESDWTSYFSATADRIAVVDSRVWEQLLQPQFVSSPGTVVEKSEREKKSGPLEETEEGFDIKQRETTERVEDKQQQEEKGSNTTSEQVMDASETEMETEVDRYATVRVGQEPLNMQRLHELWVGQGGALPRNEKRPRDEPEEPEMPPTPVVAHPSIRMQPVTPFVPTTSDPFGSGSTPLGNFIASLQFDDDDDT